MTRARLAFLLAVSLVALPAIAGLAHPAYAESPVAAQQVDEGGDCSFPYSTTDVTGTGVALGAPPDGVVTLNPSAAQTLWEIGARERVVGLTKYAAYLEGADSRRNVSGPGSIVVVERVIDLEPDLVLAPNATPAGTVEQLRGAGLTVYRFREAETVEDVYDKTRTIGRLVGECDGAEATVAEMRERIETAREAAAGEPRPDVLYAFFGYTAGDGTFVHEVIEAAGGNNVAADYGVTGYRQLSPEVVVEADPDWIVRNSNDPVMPEGAPFDATTAVREGQVVVVPIEHLNQPAPRIARAVTTLARHFHPEAYAAANATGTATATTERTPATTGEDAPPATTGTPGQPGFGPMATFAGLVVALLVLGGKGYGPRGR